MRKVWKDIFKGVMLIIAIYSGATAATVDGWDSTITAAICGLCVSLFVATKNDKE